MNIASVLNPAKTAYRVCRDSTENWSVRGNAPFALQILAYETYGDGLTQHSGAWCAQWADTTDVCLSLATAIVAEPLREQWRWLVRLLDTYSDDALRFALCVKYREGKEQFYSLSLLKVTSADKRNDRRYEKVAMHHEGTPLSALNILLQSHHGWFVRLHLAMRLREMWFQQTTSYFNRETLFPAVTQLEGDWSQAYEAFYHALRMVQELDWAKGYIECATNNSKPKPAETEAA